MFFPRFLNRQETVKDLIRADREGLWDLHLIAIQRSLYDFAAWDSTNYLRWASLYLEDMRSLETSAPTIYEKFKQGSFSIKDRPGKYIAVAGDQKLELTINRSSKCSDGVIGDSKQKQYIAQWDLIYHEMLAVNYLSREYTEIGDFNSEGYQHHNISKPHTKKKKWRYRLLVNTLK